MTSAIAPLTRQRLTNSLVPASTLLILLGLVLQSIAFARSPHTGLTWTVDGQIFSVAAGTAADLAGVQPRDRIVAINGQDWAGHPITEEYQSHIDLMIERNGEQTAVSLVALPKPASYYLDVGLQIVIVLGLLIFSLIAWLRRPYDPTVRWFIATQHLFAFLLALPPQLNGRPFFVFLLFACGFTLISPTFLQFHIILTDSFATKPRWRRGLLGVVWGCALTLIVVWIGWWLGSPAERNLFIQQLSSLLFLLVLLTSIGMLLNSYWRGSPIMRRRLRFVVMGSLTVFLLLVIFTVPFAVLGKTTPVPNQTISLLLLLIPMAYTTAVFRDGFWQMEHVVNRAVVHLFLFLLLAGSYFGIALLLPQIMPEEANQPIIWAILAFLGAVLFTPLRQQLQKWVDRLMYGGWYDYRTLIERMSQEIGTVTKATELGELLVGQLHQRMHLDGAALFLQEGGKMTAVSTIGTLQNIQPTQAESAAGQRLVQAKRPLTSKDLALNTQQDTLWVPLLRQEKLLGLLLLGRRYGEEMLGAQDRQLLQTLAWQAAIAAENIQLINTLSGRAEEVDRLYHQVTNSREEERKRLARELHDEVIQDLIHLKQVTGYVAEETAVNTVANSQESIIVIQQQLEKTVQNLRQLTSDLRPSALDDLSLRLAVQGHVAQVATETPFPIALTISGDDALFAQPLPEMLALAFFRILQEALNNARRHAKPTHVSVDLILLPTKLTLTISDDGAGFAVPSPLGALTRAGHFGLMGLQERIQAVGGQLTIQSGEGAGCCIQAVADVA